MLCLPGLSGWQIKLIRPVDNSLAGAFKEDVLGRNAPSFASPYNELISDRVLACNSDSWTRIRYFCCLTSAHKSATAAGPHTWKNICGILGRLIYTILHRKKSLIPKKNYIHEFCLMIVISVFLWSNCIYKMRLSVWNFMHSHCNLWFSLCATSSECKVEVPHLLPTALDCVLHLPAAESNSLYWGLLAWLLCLSALS